MDAARAGFASMMASAAPDVRALLQKYPTLVEVRPVRNTAIVPSLAVGFEVKHRANLEVAKQGDTELLFMGDSITDFWRNPTGNYAGKPVQDKYFSQWKVANFGIAGDTTQGVLYRLQDGEGKGFSPRAIMLMIGHQQYRHQYCRRNCGRCRRGGAVLQASFPRRRSCCWPSSRAARRLIRCAPSLPTSTGSLRSWLTATRCSTWISALASSMPTARFLRMS